ncbi:glycosyltransferase family 4 protein [Alphaproteobacteria bacterium LSUCC0684]
MLKGKVIVQILPALNRGGVERGTVETARAIVEAGGRAVVFSTGGLLVPNLKRVGGEHIDLGVDTKNPLKWPWRRKKVREALKACGADLVHVRSRAPAWISIPAARSLGLPVVTTIHGRFAASSRLKLFYNSIMTKGDQVIAISRYVQDLAASQFSAVSSRLLVIHRGVDLDMFAAASVSPQRVVKMASMLSVPDGTPVIMLPARPTGWKGAEILIDACAMMNDMKFLVLLVGAADGSAAFQSALVRKIEEAGLTEKIRLCPSQDDMPATLMLADVVAMPSITPEPFGRVAVEASAMGRPVVAFDHGGASETVEHGVTGWLATPGDAASLADCLRRALGLNLRERRAMGKAARKRVEEKFSTAMMCAKTIALYRKLLKK